MSAAPRAALVEPVRRVLGWLLGLRDAHGHIVCPEHRIEHTGKNAGAIVIACELARSGADLVRRTHAFCLVAAQRLDLQLARAYGYAERHFGGQNLYLEAMQRNARHALVVVRAGEDALLRRAPPPPQAFAA